MKGWRLLAFVAVLVEAGPLQAQDSHYWNNQYGTRASLLGGLVVGSYLDLSAAFYNPGSLTVLERGQVDLGSDAWELVDIDAKKVGGSDLDASSTRLRSVPSMFGITLPGIGKHQFALSTLTRFNFDLSTELNQITPRDSFIQNPGIPLISSEVRSKARLSESWVGISWAYPVTSTIGIGATTYAAIRTQSSRADLTSTEILSDLSVSSAIITEEFRYTHVRALWKLGVAVDLDPLTLGLTVTTPSLSISGSGRTFVERSLNDVPMGEDRVTSLEASRQDDRTARHKSAASIAVGASYGFERTRVYFSAEWFGRVGEYVVIDGQDFVGQTTGDTIPTRRTGSARAVFNAGVGVEREIAEEFTLYGAFFTDGSTDRDRDEVPGISSANWNLYHLTGGAAFRIAAVDIALGLSYGFGRSEGTDIFGPEGDRAEFSYDALKLILGFSTSLSSLADNP